MKPISAGEELSLHGRVRRSCLIYAAGLTFAAHASARTFPAGAVQLIVPFSPGSGSDFVARIFGEALTSALHQPVFVTNKPGAGGTIAASSVAQAAPDGRTLVVIGVGHLANPSLYPSLPYDTLKDFAAVGPLGTFPNVLVVPADGAITSVPQLLARAKATPDRLTYASAGVGSAAHINMQMLIAAAGIKVIHVPFKGAGEIVTETTTGRVQFGWAPLAAAIRMIKAGRLSALAISSKTRSKLLPDVPTIAEAGVPAATLHVWIGLLAPAKTPKDVVATLSDEVRKASELESVHEKLAAAGAEPMTMTPTQFDALMRSDYEILNRVMRNAN